MKLRLLCALIFIAIPGSVAAQNTSVSGTITDAGSVVWKNGTYSFTFTPSPNNPAANYFQNGVPFSKSTTISGSLDNTGSLTSVPVPDNLTISPSGSTWATQVCPAATASNGCFKIQLTITGASQSITSAVVPPAIVVNVLTPGFYAAYTDGEISGAKQGSTYFNLTDATTHVCNLPICTWLSITSATSFLTANNAFTGNNTHSGTEAFTKSLTSGLLNNACWVDGTQYATIAAANADTTNCRVIVIPPKPSGAVYTETLAANFTASATLRGILFQTDATITMGTNTFTVPSSGTSDGFFMVSPFSQGIGNLGTGVKFVYTGSGAPMTFGATTQRNYDYHIEGIALDITGAGTAVTGMQFNNLFNSRIVGNQVNCNQSGTNTQTGLFFNGGGTPGFTDLVNIADDRAINCQKPIHLTATNGFVIQGGASEYNCGNTTGGIGLTIDGSGAGSTFVLWPDIESCPSLGVDIFNNNNVPFIRAENLVGKVAQFESGAVDNLVLTDNPANTSCTDLSTNNRNHCTGFNGSAWANATVPDIFPAFMAGSQYGWSGTTNQNGTTGGAGLIGLARGSGDTGGTFYGGYFNAKSGGQGQSAEIGVSAATGDGGIALQTGVAVTNSVTVGCKWFGATAIAEDCVEGAAPSGAVNHDQFWPDSAAHRWKMNNNNAAADSVVGLATTDTFTAPKTFGAGSSINFTNLLASPTAPTIAAAGCGGGAASIVVPNGTAAFKINVGTTPGSACTFTMPAATTGWNVTCNDITTQSTSVFVQKQTGAESTTSVTITNFNDVAVATAFVASDILKCTASAD